MEHSTTQHSFADRYNEAQKLYDANDLNNCIEKAQALLAEKAMHTHLRLKTYILLASALGDWKGAKDCYERADVLLGILNRWEMKGVCPGVEEVLSELREALDALDTALQEEMAEDAGPSEDVERELVDGDGYDAEVAEMRALELMWDYVRGRKELIEVDVIETGQQMSQLHVDDSWVQDTPMEE